MAKVKPIEQLADDANNGDLIRIILKKAPGTLKKQEYSGYLLEKQKTELIFNGLPSGPPLADCFLYRKDNTLAVGTMKYKAKSYEVLRRAKK